MYRNWVEVVMSRRFALKAGDVLITKTSKGGNVEDNMPRLTPTRRK